MTRLHVRLDGVGQQARSRIRLSGPDTIRFLHGTVTADVEGLEPGHAAAAGLLTVKGKLVSEMVLLRRADEAIDVLVPLEQGETVADLLDRHIIMDEVELERLGSATLALIWNEDGSVPPAIEGEVESYITRHPAPGLLVLGAPDALDAALVGSRAVDERAFHAYRVETASPAWGHELAPDFFPPEVGFVHAVSYDKGCYLGQEPLARIHARGQVNRVMVRVEADRMPARPGPVALSHPERSDAGRWTTAVVDGSKVRGLAIVRRTFADPQAVLVAADDDSIEVRVVSGPLGDDPGLGVRARA